MNVDIDTIYQSVDLNTSELMTFVKVHLPDGTVVSACISEEDATHILNCVGVRGNAASKADQQAEPKVEVEHSPIQSVDTTPVFLPVESPVEDAVKEDLIEWETLPEEILSEQTKGLLRNAGLPSHMSEAQLVDVINEMVRKAHDKELIRQVSQRLQETQREKSSSPDEQTVVEMLPQVPSAPQKIGEVLFQVPTPRQTVPKDELGYPIVNASTKRVADAPPLGTDEDGVPQL